jgi:hypothetical protein
VRHSFGNANDNLRFAGWKVIREIGCGIGFLQLDEFSTVIYIRVKLVIALRTILEVQCLVVLTCILADDVLDLLEELLFF